MNTEMIYDAKWPEEFAERLKNDGPWANWELYKLSAEIQKTLAIPDFEGLRGSFISAFLYAAPPPA